MLFPYPEFEYPLRVDEKPVCIRVLLDGDIKPGMMRAWSVLGE